MIAPALIFEGRVLARGRALVGPVRLEVPGGRWTCLLGPSGIGKSTLLHAFAGLTDGLSIDGTVGAGDGRPLAGRTALMAQADGLLPWLTAQENVVLGDRLRRRRPDAERARALLARAGLAGLEGRKPGALSGGQRQRAALARTLYEDRPVVLLDEPFSALDVANRARMQDLAARALAGRTVLHVTHDPAEAARLGHAIRLLTPQGIAAIPPPDLPAPRAPDHACTLELTGRLTRQLLEAA
ncbi:ABC transporter ATP-binding protein [Falsirhodobacter algicola]|uniref:ATP-binding cassette domain-containing protein n=1 Tax=Falsirhodobacter algicola TaxID=2692330 RepID=A0A8J8MUX4_9RHOB|nr:ATP-binding cassette domain-containing protein [Falsirhodobacter algicola]QUS37170.1 ATP-binding cassette domain-containing protein [Falsirhodobacter algicola]